MQCKASETECSGLETVACRLEIEWSDADRMEWSVVWRRLAWRRLAWRRLAWRRLASSHARPLGTKGTNKPRVFEVHGHAVRHAHGHEERQAHGHEERNAHGHEERHADG